MHLNVFYLFSRFFRPPNVAVAAAAILEAGGSLIKLQSVNINPSIERRT